MLPGQVGPQLAALPEMGPVTSGRLLPSQMIILVAPSFLAQATLLDPEPKELLCNPGYQPEEAKSPH